MTKGIRNERLRDILEPATAALNVLKILEVATVEGKTRCSQAHAEKAFLGAARSKSSEEPDDRHQTRIAANKKMRCDQNALGPFGEAGIAFIPGLCKSIQPCYWCQTMMQCTSDIHFPDAEKERNLVQLGWDYKNDYVCDLQIS